MAALENSPASRTQTRFHSAESVSERERISQWQARTLAREYAFVFIDSYRVKLLEHGEPVREDVQICLGVLSDGSKEILDIRIPPAIAPMSENLHARGVERISTAIAGLSIDAPLRFAQFEGVHFQRSINRLMQHTLDSVPPLKRRPVARTLNGVVGAASLSVASKRFDHLAAQAAPECTALINQWRAYWPDVEALFALPSPVRKFLLSMAAVHSFDEKLKRRSLKLPMQFTSREDAVLTLSKLAMSANHNWHVAPGVWNGLKPYIPSGFRS